jgi:hypothetical protein
MNFIQYVEEMSVKIPWSGCRIWLGAITQGGYGRSEVARRKHGTTIVHRALFSELNGSVKSGLYVCHHCDTPQCVNPEHLYIGTPSDNAQDRAQKGRSAPKAGGLNGRAVLSDPQISFIKKTLGAGYKQSDVAKMYQVSQSTISRIKRGKSWGN